MNERKNWQEASKEEINSEIYRLRGIALVCKEWPCAIAADGVFVDPVVDVVKGEDGKWSPAIAEDKAIYTHMLPVVTIEGKPNVGIWPPRESPRGEGVLEAWVVPAVFYPDDILESLILITDIRAKGFGVEIKSAPNSNEFGCCFYDFNRKLSSAAYEKSLPFAISKAYVIAINDLE